jgi:hypothetical protein
LNFLKSITPPAARITIPATTPATIPITPPVPRPESEEEPEVEEAREAEEERVEVIEEEPETTTTVVKAEAVTAEATEDCREEGECQNRDFSPVEEKRRVRNALESWSTSNESSS